MKPALFILFLLTNYNSYSQDTINLVKYPDGCKSYWLINKSDTVILSTYSNGKIESKRFYKNSYVNGKYFRWYENGNLMWVKEMVNNTQEGSAVFYNDKEIKVAELIYHNGIISDTVFIKDGIHLVLGNISFTSKIYGGMENDDGSSNVSEYSGPYQNLNMYAVKVDSLLKPVFIQNFKSDDRGDFFILAPIGKIGFFPKTIPIKDLMPGQYFPPSEFSNSTESGWSMNGPLIINNEQIIFIQIHHTSVGYAP